MTNSDNLDDFNELMKSYGRQNMKPTKANLPLNDLAQKLCKEGLDLLEKEQPTTQPPATEPVKPITPVSKDNPYMKARIQLLASFSEWRQKEILQLEKANDRTNRHYDDFVRQVVTLGDKLSN